MTNPSKFCTCTDLSCPYHPTNHDKGCAPCVAANLKDNDIPTCFFNKMDPDYHGDSNSYTFETFAKMVLENDNK